MMVMKAEERDCQDRSAIQVLDSLAQGMTKTLYLNTAS